MAGTSNRGFGSMDASKQKEIASKGGKASSMARSTAAGGAQKHMASGAAGSTEAAKRGGQNSHRTH